jgi:hypothetical protein
LIVDPETVAWTGISIRQLDAALVDLGVRTCYFQPKSFDRCSEDRKNLESIPLFSRSLGVLGRLSETELFYICSKLTCSPCEIDTTSSEVVNLRQQFRRDFDSCISYMQEIIKTNNIKLLLAFQGYNLPSSAARYLSKEMKIPLVAVENTFSNGHIIAEPFSGCAVNRTLALNMLWRYSEFFSENLVSEYADSFRKMVFKNKIHCHTSPNVPFLREKRRDRIVFMGQVLNDSSLVFGTNPRFESQVDVILSLIKYCIDNEIELVVKLHPKESNGFDFNGKPFEFPTWKRILQRCASANENPFVTIDMDNSFNSESILSTADLVVTVNSQSGIEAALLGKRVILCGSAFYDSAGFTTSVYSFEGLYSEVRQQIGGALSSREKAAVEEFVYCYFNLFCIKKTTHDLSKCMRHYIDNCFLPYRSIH